MRPTYDAPSRSLGFVVRHASSSTAPASTPAAAAPVNKRRRGRAGESDLGITDLVAPPDPISNIRPIIYASPFSTQHAKRTPNSPYSASEFASFDAAPLSVAEERDTGGPGGSLSGGRRDSNGGVRAIARGKVNPRLQELELEWKLRRERVDAVNHRFWFSMNTQFHSVLASRLAPLPPPPTPSSHPHLSLTELAQAQQELDDRREAITSQFYADWQAAKRVEMGRWVRGWWRDVWEGVLVQGKIYWVRFLGR